MKLLNVVIRWFKHELISFYYLICSLFNSYSLWHVAECNHTKSDEVILLSLIDNPSISKSGTMFLCNHRCFADFYIDSAITNSSYLSRMMVMFGAPISCLFAWINDRILFINRGKSNKKYITSLVKSNYDNQHKNILVYPESHRQQTNKSLELKYGMIRQSYRNNIPIQIVITTNKEKIWCLQTLEANSNVECLIYVSNIIYPKDSNNIDEWCKLILNEWNDLWKFAYSKNIEKTYIIPFKFKVDSSHKVNSLKLYFVLLCFFIFFLLIAKSIQTF
jgi:hypothetical protein